MEKKVNTDKQRKLGEPQQKLLVKKITNKIKTKK